MGRKTKSSRDLGRSLIKDRFGANRGKKHVSDPSMLHTTEVQDGYNWCRLNLQSVTEESSFQEFLSTAELAGTEFQAEKLNIKFINPQSNVGLLSEEEREKVKETFIKERDFITIPRRPKWNSNTTPEELDQNEKKHFLDWRRDLAEWQEKTGLLLTPYEKNLEFWRQLWRVVERSDVVIQIVDARNPEFFYNTDLDRFVKEVSPEKTNLILINKADYLTKTQRGLWAEYFDRQGIQVVFYSAVCGDQPETITEKNEDFDENKDVQELQERVLKILKDPENGKANSSEILSRDQLIDFFKTVHKGSKLVPNQTTIGLVGYPNVGKSSTINSLFLSKKVSVSATPGKTKHFQTLFLDEQLMLCDCPGLVMPNFVYTKADMILDGILPVDQMRDHVPPTNLICNLIPRHVLEDKYGIMLPKPMEGEDQDRCPTAEELLNAYAFNRGFMTANGQPDNPRAARYIIKDFLNGKLLYCHAPPDFDQEKFNTWPERQKTISVNKTIPPRQARAVKSNCVSGEDIDKMFFEKTDQVHRKGIIVEKNNGNQEFGEKPWKKINKHANKNKKEKLRRVYAHLDQH